MATDSRGDLAVHPAFKGLLEAVLRQQQAGGRFCATGAVDWQQPIDHPKQGEDALGSRMLPALWGNARLLCGLVDGRGLEPIGPEWPDEPSGLLGPVKLIPLHAE